MNRTLRLARPLLRHAFCNARWECRQFHHQILSGIQPTGDIHIGNYFGAIKQWVELQEPCELPGGNTEQTNPRYLPPIFQIVDLHSLTTLQDPDLLRRQIVNVAAVLLGCGIDPSRCILFKQSSVPYHGYLCWILTTITTLPQLKRFPQFKEKSAVFREAPTGLFVYPVLQVADILLYKGTHVPIGDDQLPHINLSKHLAAKFNNTFKTNLFPIPLEIGPKDGAGRIKSLRLPEKKMSKSELDTKSRIELTDSSDEIIRKVRKAVTDMKSEVTYEPQSRPGVSNLVLIYSVISGLTPQQVCAQFVGKDTFHFKLEVAELLVEFMKPIRTRIVDYQANPEYLESVLKDGAIRALQLADITISEVQQVLGMEFASLSLCPKSSSKVSPNHVKSSQSL